MPELVGVVGAGAMGAGIAEVAAVAGRKVLLYDAAPGAADKARTKIEQRFSRKVEEGRMELQVRDAICGRISSCQELADLAQAGLVIEAIVEDLKVKQELFTSLESILAEDAILASNTSSLSITELASNLKHRGRFAGLHFFNPAPVMSLVEVVSGLATSSAVMDTLVATVAEWGKTPVRVRSAPGFIVNKGARPFYGEALRVLDEGAAEAETIDALIRANGFKMGPLELIDLVGLDINLAVSRRMTEAYYGESRYKPSFSVENRVAAGWLGRKTGKGFYEYGNGDKSGPFVYQFTDSSEKFNRAITVHGDLGPAQKLISLWRERGFEVTQVEGEGWIETEGAWLALTDGRMAAERHAQMPGNWVLFDLALDYEKVDLIALTGGPGPDRPIEFAAKLFQFLDKQVSVIEDTPGMLNARTFAMLVNEGFDSLSRRIASEEDIDVAMRKGLNFPGGPFQWCGVLSAPYVVRVLDNMRASYGEERYRASVLLRRHALNWKAKHD